jgi:hypothetical protein
MADIVTELIEQRKHLAAHLLKVMEVALDNMEYASSSDKAKEQLDTVFAARDYLIEQKLVTREMLP